MMGTALTALEVLERLSELTQAGAPEHHRPDGRETVDPWAPVPGAERWERRALAAAYTGNGTRDPRTSPAGGVPSVEQYRRLIGMSPSAATPKPPPAIRSASLWASHLGTTVARIPQAVLTRAELFEIVGQNVAEKARGHEAQLDAYLGHLAAAFRAARIDTAEAQAVYLAHAAGETIFATLTEGQRTPFVNDPTQVEITRDPRGPLRYRGKRSIDPLGRIDSSTNPTYAETFIGRGPVQVTHDYNYVRALVYLEEMARRATAADAQLMWRAVAAIKRDPRQAARPAYSFLFSAAYMHMSGGVRAAARLGGRTPSFSGQDAASGWVAGGGFNIHDRYHAAARALANARAKGDPQAIASAQAAYNEWGGHKSRADIKAAAYRRAVGILRRKAQSIRAEALDRPFVEDEPGEVGTPAVVAHRHVRRTCPDGRTWKPDPAAGDMSPGRMNPGFISSADALVLDPALHRGLWDLLLGDAEYRKLLTATSIAERRPKPGDQLRVALADLSGDKLCRPRFVGWGSMLRMMGTSSAKIALLYAAHQLIFDLNELAKTRRPASEADLRREAGALWSAFTCPPDLKWLISVDTAAQPLSVKMSAALQQHLERMVDATYSGVSTGKATDLVLRIGFEYLGSVLWQSGLRHATRGGLWFPNTYADAGSGVASQGKCRTGSGPVKWKQNPIPEPGITITALSAVTYMTLLAQRRLVDGTHSTQMENLLSRGCTWVGGVAGARVRATKCGVASGHRHEVLLLESGKLRYAFAYLTRSASQWTDATHERFARDIHRLITRNNP